MSGLQPRKATNLEAAWNGGKPKLQHLVPAFLGRGEACLLYGESGSGKTMVLVALAAAVAAGRDVLAEFPASAPSRVLYIDEEVGENEFVRRLRLLANGMSADPSVIQKNIRFFPQQGHSLQTDDEITEFHGSVRDFNPRLIIIDTLVSVYGGDENDNSAVRRWFKRVVSPLSADGRSVILSHHEKKETKDSWRWNKLTRLRGATDLRSYPDKIWHSNKVKDTTSTAGNGVLRIQLSTLKARRGDEIPTFPVEFRDSEDGERIVLSCVELTPQSAATFGNERTCKKAILQRLHSGNGSCERKTLWDIPEQLRCNRKALNRALTALAGEGRIHPLSRSGSSLVTLVQVPLPS